MSFVITSDGTVIPYKDWGSGSPVVFSHGWPLVPKCMSIDHRLRHRGTDSHGRLQRQRKEWS